MPPRSASCRLLMRRYVVLIMFETMTEKTFEVVKKIVVAKSRQLAATYTCEKIQPTIFSFDWSLYASTAKSVKVDQYQGRFCQGWFFVEFEDVMEYDLRSVEEKIDGWIAENIEGPSISDPAGRLRRYFREETDAMLCFMAFR